jgi:hypothetical protein
LALIDHLRSADISDFPGNRVPGARKEIWRRLGEAFG